MMKLLVITTVALLLVLSLCSSPVFGVAVADPVADPARGGGHHHGGGHHYPPHHGGHHYG